MYGSIELTKSYNFTCLSTENIPTGPLTYTENEQTFLVGVMSWGKNIPCGHPRYPGVYAKVTKALEWIRQEDRNFRGFIGKTKLK